MAQNKTNGFLLILIIALAIFGVYSYNTESSDKEYYYEFSQLDLLNTSLKVIDGEDFESLRISDYSGTDSFLLSAPSSDLDNLSKYTVEYAFDLSNTTTGDSLAIFLSQDTDLTQNETNRDNLIIDNNEEYYGAFLSGSYDSYLGSDLIIGGRNDVGNAKVVFTHEVDLTSGTPSGNTIISTLVDGETIVTKQFSLEGDVSKNNGNPLVFDTEGNIAINLFAKWSGLNDVSLSENSSYVIEYIKVYDIE